MSGAAKKKKEKRTKKQKKEEYFVKLKSYLSTYSKIMVVIVDNIGSNQMQKIRKSLRGKAAMLMGKNTMMRRVIRLEQETNPETPWQALLPIITGNVGLIFTNGDLSEVRNIISQYKIPAAAKPGIKAPQDVIIPKGVTNLEPTKTSFLQALNIASKITKGTIEIIQDVYLIKKDDKVGSSESTLLQMLDIKPFEYGLQIKSLYDDGSIFDIAVLDLSDADILQRFSQGVTTLASVSLGVGYHTLASFPHLVMNAYKNLLSIAVGTDYVFPQAEKIKQMAENPDAFKSAAPVPAPTAGGSAPAPAPVAEPEEEPEEEMAFDLFG